MDTPDSSPPPRQVMPWTRVPGHHVVGRLRAFCECGAQPKDTDGTHDPDEWREEHLRDAWPILVPRVEGETLEAWMGRISDRLVEASAREQALFDRDGLGFPIPPGGQFPTISAEYEAASDRVEILQHQLDEVRTRVVGRRM